MKAKYFVAAFGAALLLSAPAQAAVNLLTNGDFELGVNGGLPAGWNTTSAPNGEIIVLTGSQYVPCCGVTGSPASLANSFASFGAGNVATEGAYLRQTFDTVVGANYNVSFDFGALGAGGPLLLNFVVFDATGAPNIQLINTASANNNLDTTFSRYFGSFTANGTQSTVVFQVLGPSGNIDGILDNVSVTGGVPEPATWAMMLIGFAGLGFAASRKDKISPTPVGA